MSKELEYKLNAEVYRFFRVKNEKATKIQKCFKKSKMRFLLMKLANRNRLLKKIYSKSIIKQLASKYYIKFEEQIKIE